MALFDRSALAVRAVVVRVDVVRCSTPPRWSFPMPLWRGSYSMKERVVAVLADWLSKVQLSRLARTVAC